MKSFLSLGMLLLGCSICSYSQTLSNAQLHQKRGYAHQKNNVVFLNPSFQLNQDSVENSSSDSFPSPKSVMYKSMIIPGWGQITNRQIWKVPIVYGLLGGLAWYSMDLTKRYHDYRAAYYNLNSETDDDMRFGPTPDYIPESANLQELKSIRNTYRNRRDMVYIGIGLAYGLNVIDAYVFAHMRSFDVSEDLSMKTRIKPSVMAQATPGFTLSIDLITK
ncbi:hypothetical protein J6I44_10725 [Aliifodinibius sp. 1BSP15-2V2]|uniref:DUF5683 domain-containing protein n=1 Tax=Fodinibius salsisoli TaxID=2820877 RepID=A0ABT3PNC1_9BACT|nr:hypothetical protein [Fodinibius salsisoli]